MDNESRTIGNTIEYKLDLAIANRIKDLCLGLNGSKRHSWRALSIQVTGYECQMTGQDLERLAQWTLGLDAEWNEPVEEETHPNGKSGAW